jgi:hypothetical protein
VCVIPEAVFDLNQVFIRPNRDGHREGMVRVLEGNAMRDGFPDAVAVGLGLAFAFALSLLVFVAFAGSH